MFRMVVEGPGREEGCLTKFSFFVQHRNKGSVMKRFLARKQKTFSWESTASGFVFNTNMVI